MAEIVEYKGMTYDDESNTSSYHFVKNGVDFFVGTDGQTKEEAEEKIKNTEVLIEI